MTEVTEHVADAGAYVLARDDLSEFHYQFDAGPPGGPEHRHGSAWSDSVAWTHCICFGAAARAVEPLLVENERLRALLREVLGSFTERGHPGHECLRTPWRSVEWVAEKRAAVTGPSATRDSDDPSSGVVGPDYPAGTNADG